MKKFLVIYKDDVSYIDRVWFCEASNLLDALSKFSDYVGESSKYLKKILAGLTNDEKLDFYNNVFLKTSGYEIEAIVTDFTVCLDEGFISSKR